MVPFYKLMSLVIRVFSRPVVNYTKKYHLHNKSRQAQRLQAFFMYFGNLQHQLDFKINKSLQGVSTKNHFLKPLNKDLALERGVEFFYEIVVYIILIGVPILEMAKQQQENDKKLQLLK